MRDGALREMTVRVEGGRLTWGETDAADPLARYFQDHGVVLQEGQTAEVNLESAPLLDGILRRCGESGLMVILDYGYPARRLYDPRGRRGGSLVAYRNHSVEPDLLRDPGAQDLTAHVNWDDLERVAESRGWGTVGRFPLAEFLIRAGLAEAMDREGLGEQAELDAATVAERQEIKRLLDPDGMGSDLKVLVIGRGTMARSAEETLTIDL
jgi:SAM-dependent MidA family methyltransferase